jgi:hypothetical protein
LVTAEIISLSLFSLQYATDSYVVPNKHNIMN